jgi:rod shape-determining protein MreD
MKLPASVGSIFFSLVGAYLLSCCRGRARGCSRVPTSCCSCCSSGRCTSRAPIGQGVAFSMGLLMDVSDSMLLGQHALAYVIAVFGAQVLRVRILTFHCRSRRCTCSASRSSRAA